MLGPRWGGDSGTVWGWSRLWDSALLLVKGWGQGYSGGGDVQGLHKLCLVHAFPMRLQAKHADFFCPVNRLAKRWLSQKALRAARSLTLHLHLHCNTVQLRL